METSMIIQVAIGVIVALIANYVRELKNDIKENFKSIWLELDKKQEEKSCIQFHKAHSNEHILEKQNIEDKLRQNKDDINNIGEIARGNNG